MLVACLLSMLSLPPCLYHDRVVNTRHFFHYHYSECVQEAIYCPRSFHNHKDEWYVPLPHSSDLPPAVQQHSTMHLRPTISAANQPYGLHKHSLTRYGVNTTQQMFK
ncbi:hypothetical protein E2C01_060977 [Portunus trituberculatus]|uniref:Secreted protein n=1 Tax=Portunus trituberculatus TaxID=210409 RepID=A0A5B7HDU2_PORTR|nr:hypothetical protein [Portunus trituberculatus]